MVSEISNSNRLNANSRMTGYNKRLQVRAAIKDIYVNLTGLYKRTEKEIPNSIYMKVEDATAGSTKVVITMRLPLTGSIVSGNDRLIGNEVSPTTKDGTIYRNNYKFAVKTETYNTRKLEQEDYGLFEAHIKSLGLYAQQFKGMQIRQALLRRYSNDFISGDILSEGISQQWNPNVYIQGATDANQPAYSTTNQTFINNIVASMWSVDGTLDTQSVTGAANFRMLNKIALRALTKKLMPLDIEGNDAFILTMSALNAAVYGDPTVSSSHGDIWANSNRLSETVQNWYGVIGKFRSTIGVDIYVVTDPKSPSVLPGGSSPPYTLLPGYMEPGDTDNRNHTNAKTRDVGILLGKGALVEWEPEPLHFVTHEDDYGRVLGTGIAGTRGIQLLTFDSATQSASSIEYYGSMLCFMSRFTTY